MFRRAYFGFFLAQFFTQIWVAGCLFAQSNTPQLADMSVHCEKMLMPVAAYSSAEDSQLEFAVFDSIAQLENRILEDSGALIVINFWATWCKPCVEELPFFEELHSKYRDQKVSVLLVSLDFKSQMDKRLRPFLRDNNIKAEVALLADQDADFWIPKVHSEWDGAIPATVIINPKNRKKGFYNEKFEDYSELESFVSKFF